MRFATASAALVASASSAMAVGNAIIVNNCPYAVNVISVSNEPGPDNTLAANGGRYSESFRENPNGGGISLKVNKVGDAGTLVSQFEYTYNPPSNAYPGVFWDLSLINGNVFQDTVVSLIPTIMSGNAGGSCTNVVCQGGTSCKDAYNNPWENDATRQCPADTDLTYYLCSNGPAKAVSSSAPASSSPAASPPAASPVELKVETTPSPAAKPSPAPAPAAPQPVTHLVVGSTNNQMGEPLELNAVEKREAHANHMERHNRIRRMHHARTAA